MSNKIITLLIILITFGGVISCGDEREILDSSTREPDITFAFDVMKIDMNLIDNLPVVAIIRSELGLKNVLIQIKKTDNNIIDYKTFTEFFNENSFSYAEKINYSADYQSIIITATDKLDRSISETLPLNITEVKEAPSIIFNPSSILYDEIEGGEMPETNFTVQSVAGLKSLEMFLVAESGQTQYGFPIDFPDKENEYTFNQQIMYKEGDKGFRVKATDIYGQVKIATLPVQYLTPTPPVVTITEDTIYADKDQTKIIPLQITSQRGIAEIKIYRIEDGIENLVHTIVRDDKPLKLNLTPEVTCTNATSKIKIVVSDVVNKSSEALITAIVNMYFTAHLEIGTHPLANGYSGYPNVYSLLSLKDFKTYPVDYAVENEANASNVDLKFYAFGGQAVLRMYSIDGGTGTKSNEFRGSSGKSVLDMPIQNATKVLKLVDFDFDNATAESITRDIPLSNIVSNTINPFNVGDVLAFKTASTSTSGGDRVGIMKILDNKQVNPSNVTARVITVSIKFPK
ncbi:hypothetical protein [Proteiniphilum sp. UBA1028]|jgi:hypothetical protein|uniref:hypothetical protein n=1 Tax=Proteiniphilum sp. UBA1028 TaxID=1947251 RepID=UPI0025E70CFD|nr:hypothetical protein [Proteiniphilum sp. UBA1028]